MPEQVLQDVDRDVRPFLDQLGQVLADDLAGEMPVQEVVQAACRASSVSEVIGERPVDHHLHALLLDAGFGVPQHEAVGSFLVVLPVLAGPG